MNGDIGIGTILKTEMPRDAIHVAVAPMESAEKLSPGARVGIGPDGKAAEIEPAVGIVDPFLTKVVRPGQRFYLFMFPGTITSLRHEWTHPAFGGAHPPAPTAPDKSASEKWLREYANRVNSQLVESYGDYKGSEEEAYQSLLSDLRQNSLTYHGTDMHSRAEVIDPEELQHHASVVLGREVNLNHFEYFSCSC